MAFGKVYHLRPAKAAFDLASVVAMRVAYRHPREGRHGVGALLAVDHDVVTRGAPGEHGQQR